MYSLILALGLISQDPNLKPVPQVRIVTDAAIPSMDKQSYKVEPSLFDEKLREEGLPKYMIEKMKKRGSICYICKRPSYICKWVTNGIKDECSKAAKENRSKYFNSKEGKQWRRDELLKKAKEMQLEIEIK